MAISEARRSERHGSRWRGVVWAGAGALLSAPLIAMQVTDAVRWGPADFILFGAMLAGAIGAYEFLARRTGDFAYRTAAGIALAGAFLLVWSNAAVGIVGTESDDANLLFYGVLAVGLIGAVAARFRAGGMARALYAMTLAQVVVAALALTGGVGFAEVTSSVDVVLVTGFFAAWWLASAWLFGRAAR